MSGKGRDKLGRYRHKHGAKCGTTNRPVLAEEERDGQGARLLSEGGGDRSVLRERVVQHRRDPFQQTEHPRGIARRLKKFWQ